MKALIITDMLNDFVRDDGTLQVPATKDIIRPIKELLAHARSQGWTVVFIADQHSPNDKEFDIWGAHAVKGTQGSQVIDELAPLPGETIVGKTRYSGFFHTKLDQVLCDANVSTIILTGTLTDICVLYTSADAVNRDMTVIVAMDGTATLSPERQKWALEHMKSVLNVKLKTCSEIIAGE